MAWLVKKKSGIYHLGFRFVGEEITLKTRHERTAQAALHRIEETISLIERGRLEIPEEADVGTFMFSDGKIERPVQTCVRSKRLTLGQLFECYSCPYRRPDFVFGRDKGQYLFEVFIRSGYFLGLFRLHNSPQHIHEETESPVRMVADIKETLEVRQTSCWTAISFLCERYRRRVYSPNWQLALGCS